MNTCSDSLTEQINKLLPFLQSPEMVIVNLIDKVIIHFHAQMKI